MEDVVIDPAFWRGRRVLLTGHTGFKGSWTSIWLLRLGAEVFGYALQAPTSPNLFDVANVARGMRSVHGDIRDLDALLAVMREVRPDIVVHMAAQSLVRASYKDPVGTYITNVIGTANVLECVRRQDTVRVALNITSDKCYENAEWVWGYRETDPMGGSDPYSSSKGCSELITTAYRRSFFSDQAKAPVAVASARAGNVIGGGDWAPDRLIPDLFRAIERRDTLVIRNPEAIRPWQHVLEPLSGYLLLIQALWASPMRYSEAWNFGPNTDQDWAVHRIIEELLQFTRMQTDVKKASDRGPKEASFLKVDSSKARSRLGWKPRLSTRDALKLTAEWYDAYLMGDDMRQLTESQIDRYGALA